MSKRVKRKSRSPEAGTAQAARRDNVIHLPLANRAEAPANVSEVVECVHESEAHEEGETVVGLRGTHALTSHDHDDDHEEVERFFSSVPPAPDHSHDHFHDLEPLDHHEHDPVHAAGHHRGRKITIAVALLGTALIGGFLVYHKLMMPTPEDLTGAPRVALPTPAMLDAVPELQNPAPTQAAPEAPAKLVEVAAAQPAVEPAPVAQVAEPVAPEPVAKSVEPAAQAAKAVESAQPAPASAVAPAGYGELVAQARKLGFKKSAEASFLQAITVHPTGSDALSGLAMLYLNQSKYKPARDRARESVNADPSNSEGWIVLGAALSALGDAPGARDAYARCATQGVGKYVTECKRMRR